MDVKRRTPDELSTLKAQGNAFGLNLITRPTNLELYRRYLPGSLDMPETPMVGVFQYHFPITNAHPLIPNGHYAEAGILLYCQRDGIAAWAEAAIFISWFGYIFGSLGGSRKVRIDQITLSSERSAFRGCTEKGGANIMDFCYTSNSVEHIRKEINPTPWQLSMLNGQRYSPHIIEPRIIISKVIKRTKILELRPIMQDVKTQPGIIDLKLASGHHWSNLINQKTRAPGIFFDFKPDWSQLKL